MNLSIKNMVCDRCIMVVRQQLEASSIAYENVQLGEVVLCAPLPEQLFSDLKAKLAALGFEVLDDRKAAIVTRIKSTIIRLVHQTDALEVNTKISILLSESLDLDYSYLSALFSSIEGITIEKYVILQRIERVKELLAYNEMNLSEIAYNLGYSSVQHLSLQFKKVTGLTPSQFKQQKFNQRTPLDKVGH